MSKLLPVKPNLYHLKVQAKRLQRDLAQSNPSIRLQTAQNCLSREYGFSGWSELLLHLQRVEKVDDLVNQFIWTPGKEFPALRESGIVDLKIVEAGTLSPKAKIRRSCLQLLDHLGGQDCFDILIRATFDPVARVRMHAVHALGCQECKGKPFPKEVVLQHLIRCGLSDPSERVRYQAVWALGSQEHESKIIETLERILREDLSPRMQRAANYALAKQNSLRPAHAESSV